MKIKLFQKKFKKNRIKINDAVHRNIDLCYQSVSSALLLNERLDLLVAAC